MKYDRLNEMEAFIASKKSVTNEALCEMFGISIPTLRRDISQLIERGNIEKVYGGVVYSGNQVKTEYSPYQNRSVSYTNEKERIGKLAAKFVKSGDVIFVDSGTTVSWVIKYITDCENVTVVTHSLNAAEMLAMNPNVKGILLGGVLNRDTNSFEVDSNSIPYRFSKSFVSTVGIDPSGCTNVNIMESNIKRYAIKQSKESYLLVDHSKFGVPAFNCFAKIEEFDKIITDQEVPEWLNDLAKNKHIQVITK